MLLFMKTILAAFGLSDLPLTTPVLEIDGKETSLPDHSGPVAGLPGLTVRYEAKQQPGSAFLRYRFTVSAEQGYRFLLTKTRGTEGITYGTLTLPEQGTLTEVRFSEFDERIHSYRMVERPVGRRWDGQQLMGPLLAWEAADQSQSWVWAYEHGSQTPDAFLAFRPQGKKQINLEAVKGNTCRDQVLDADHPFVSVYFQLGRVAGGLNQLRQAYRRFLLRGQTSNQATRQPHLFYNTWNFQERNATWYGKKYLDSMNQARMLAEIDVAAQLGVEVFVLDVGWFLKAGDWEVNRERFPDGLEAVRAKLRGFGMKLGLWFNPTAVAVTSRLAKQSPETRVTWKGDLPGPWKIWETEESFNHCLVSGYEDLFAKRLIELNRELGVTYFKWDAVGQYGCDSPLHHHGDERHTSAERADAYAYGLPLALARVADLVAEACPGALCDFDVTEDKRAVGLGFLASGKYFLINNGPYHSSFDDKLVNGGGMGANVLAFPGPARPRFLRTPLDYDTWIPSTLFLSHYLAEGSQGSQIANLASMFLGQNGVWGDLLALTNEGIAFWGEAVRRYKIVREAITQAFPERTGDPGSSPEIVEKLDPETGCGLISLFSSMAVPVTYVTRHRVKDAGWALGPVTVERLADGCARLTFSPGEENPDGVFGRIGVEAALVLFGTAEE